MLSSTQDVQHCSDREGKERRPAGRSAGDDGRLYRRRVCWLSSCGRTGGVGLGQVFCGLAGSACRIVCCDAGMRRVVDGAWCGITLHVRRHV